MNRRAVGLLMMTVGVSLLVVSAIGLSTSNGDEGVTASRREPSPTTLQFPSTRPSTTSTTREPEITATDPLAVLAAGCTKQTILDSHPVIAPGVLITEVSQDPRVDRVVPLVGFEFAEPMTQDPAGGLDVLSTFALIAVIDDTGDAVEPLASGDLIDQLGTTQLWFVWDGTATYKIVRSIDGSGEWTMRLEDDAEDVTAQLTAGAIRFWWDALTPTMKFGALAIELSDKCAQLGLSGQHVPTQQVSVG